METETTTVVTTSSRIFLIAVLVVAILIMAYAIVNIYYYRQIATGKTVSRTAGSVLFWISIALLIIAFFVLLWALWQLVVPPSVKTALSEERRRFVESGTTYAVGAPYTD
jgi:uncharacterized membrane protein YidH (DUF202 family)